MDRKKVSRLVKSMGPVFISFTMILTSCGKAGKEETSNRAEGFSKDSYSIGVAMTLGHPYWKNMERGAKEEAQEWAAKYGIKVQVTITNAEEDPKKQIAQIQNLIGKRVDAAVLVPIKKDALVDGVLALNAANIPVIILNREVAGGCEYIAYTGTDTYQGAIASAQILMEAIHGEGEIAELYQLLGTGPQILRSKALDDTLRRYPKVKLVARVPHKQDRTKAIAATQNLLNRFPNLKGIYAQGDIYAMAAADACSQITRNDIAIVGMGGSKEAIEAIRSGRITGTSFQQPYEEGRMGVRLAMRYLKGEKLEREYPIPCPKITRDNAEGFEGQF